ncbi:MAG: tRNA (adenosine(37)-N6)-threonylcarbamoyltransferase complex ATPase subunit type 1 TsaE [Planctomycetota bacterium]
MQFVSHDPDATLALARHVGSHLKAGEVLALSGDLGAGKTTFVRGLAEGLGITDPVSSPTYTLMHSYEGPGLGLLHYDAWMEGRQKALLAGGGSGVIEGDAVAVVEWASKVADFLPDGALWVEFGHRDEHTRTLVFSGPMGRWSEILGDLPAIAGLEPPALGLHSRID